MSGSRSAGQALNFFRRGILLLVNVLVSVLIICYEIYGPVVVEKAPGTDIRFSISKDESMHKVAKELYDDGLIVNRYSFYIRTMLMDRDEMKLKPGDYILNTSMDYEEILDMLTKSD